MGKYFKSGSADFSECLGILFAIALSVTITMIMEGSSNRAFETLNRIYDNVAVRVLRGGKTITISQTDVIVGDIILLESGDKIIADGRLIESVELTVDESSLTGESEAQKKNASAILNTSLPLAERINCVFSGTFVTSGTGKMVVTAVGSQTEIGSVAGELNKEKETHSPLQTKLNNLGKIITLIGAVSAVIVFIISLVRLAIGGTLNFSGVQELAISCIVLIVAAVPEGLPTIVAMSLALNMIKLAKGNALIKKMSATETAGAVSVICSDKTGTITENKMTVSSVCVNEFCFDLKKGLPEQLLQNFVLNSTADLIRQGKRVIGRGNGTECALLSAYEKNAHSDYEEYRKKFKVVDRVPFSSEKKIMSTTILVEGTERKLIKGAPEKVLPLCNLSESQIKKLYKDMEKHQKDAKRVLCFAHDDGEKCVYDGYVTIKDPIRKEVFKAVKDCKRAGIKLKMLTGDNALTAFAIAKELGIVKEESQVINASELEKLDDEGLKKIVQKVHVIARSTPIVKLRVVKALKSLGEVVAVTGDGINDAPAIKHADVGIAMGVSGSEISREAADIVLLDDSFATVVTAVAFGRNVYKNLQRFILFQLSVNLSALLYITISAILNLPTPFNTLQLLWINVIMDGPPALTLGLESASEKLMEKSPVRRSDSIVGIKMFIRILINGIFISAVMLMQYLFNFLNVSVEEMGNACFSLFILFQLFNAFNSRELGAESIFKSIGKNKIMVITFVSVFVLHFVISQAFSSVLGVYPMCLTSWIKVILTASSIVVVTEGCKLLYRSLKKEIKVEKKIKSIWKGKEKIS